MRSRVTNTSLGPAAGLGNLKHGLVVVLGLPPAECRPNRSRHLHWGRIARAVKAYRREAYLATVAARNTHVLTGLPWRRAAVRATFFHRQHRRRDRDNLLASLKPAFDGLADAGIVADDSRLVHMPVEQRLDRQNPRVEITVEALP